MSKIFLKYLFYTISIVPLICTSVSALSLQESLMSEEWDEYEDKSDILWNYQVWPLNMGKMTCYQISVLFGVNHAEAFELKNKAGNLELHLKALQHKKQQEKTAPNIISSQLSDIIMPSKSGKRGMRYTLRLNRKYGEENDDDLQRYIGSSPGITQRCNLEFDQYLFGFVMDKDRFEPDINDLYRVWGAWRSSDLEIVLGDFHFNSGNGLGIWTQPVYFRGFDNPSFFSRLSQGIKPATDSGQNQSLRGISVSANRENVNVKVFAANTWLDAIKDQSTGEVLRLSNNGLHRSFGEQVKQNTIREKSLGGGVEFSRSFPSFKALCHVDGYYSSYSPRLQTDPEPRRIFPLIGNQAGGSSIGIRIESSKISGYFDTGSDHEGHLAFLGGFTKGWHKLHRIQTNAIFYSYPKVYHNPRSNPPSGGVSPENRKGAAFLVKGRPKNWRLSKWSAHIEIENSGWRTYTVPTPKSGSKFSFETNYDLTSQSLMTVRIRRNSSLQGDGELASVSSQIENRIRVTYDFRNGQTNNLRLFTEGMSFQESKINGYGTMIGFKWFINTLSRTTNSVRIKNTLAMTGFTGKRESVFYLGESGIPQMFSSVRLSGRGLHWSLASTWYFQQRSWAGIQVSQTHKFFNPVESTDLSVVVGASYILKIN